MVGPLPFDCTGLTVYDVDTDEQEKETMTNSTGSNNLAGLLGGLVDAIETVIDVAGGKLSEFGESFTETDEDEDLPGSTYKAVFNLGLSDALVLDDGSWQVLAVESDAFDPDLVQVTLDNGEDYVLLRTSLVRVV